MDNEYIKLYKKYCKANGNGIKDTFDEVFNDYDRLKNDKQEYDRYELSKEKTRLKILINQIDSNISIARGLIIPVFIFIIGIELALPVPKQFEVLFRILIIIILAIYLGISYALDCRTNSRRDIYILCIRVIEYIQEYYLENNDTAKVVDESKLNVNVTLPNLIGAAKEIYKLGKNIKIKKDNK